MGYNLHDYYTIIIFPQSFKLLVPSNLGLAQIMIWPAD